MKHPNLRSSLSAAIFTAALSLAATASTPNSMKAIEYSDYGPSSVLHLVDVARPVPGAGEVLVQVHAAGVNTIDWELRKEPTSFFKHPLPVIPGYDLSGEIVAVGSAVSGRKVGEPVFAMLPLDAPRAYAQYVALDAGLLAVRPKNLNDVQAASVPLVALTAYQALFDAGQLKAGQTVLIHGGAGGVGHFAVQLAKNAGATVVATASESNLAFLKQIGADTAIDYRAQRFEDVVRDVDLVLDTVGGDTLKRSYAVVKRGGAVVSIAGRIDKAELEQRGIHGTGVLVKPDAAELTRIAKLIEQGALKPEIDSVYALQEAARAHDKSESRHLRGRLVLDVDAVAK